MNVGTNRVSKDNTMTDPDTGNDVLVWLNPVTGQPFDDPGTEYPFVNSNDNIIPSPAGYWHADFAQYLLLVCFTGKEGGNLSALFWEEFAEIFQNAVDRMP